jgi:hypothetical protein
MKSIRAFMSIRTITALLAVIAVQPAAKADDDATDPSSLSD